MNRIQYLLAKVAEESSEITKAAIKAQLFGLSNTNPNTGNTNEQEIKDEVADIFIILVTLKNEFGIEFIDHTNSIGVPSRSRKVDIGFDVCKYKGYVDETTI